MAATIPAKALWHADMAQLQSQELTGLTAVVTGSSSGIGRAVAMELASAGADVMVHAAHNQSGAEETAEAVRQLGRKTLVETADFADPEAVDKFAAAAWDWHHGADIWINNAGADILIGSAAKLIFAQKLDLLWKIDVQATIQLSRQIGERMRKRGHGVIVNVGWDQVETGMAGDSGELFAATKGAVTAFSRSLAKSLAPKVRVNCVAPGWIKTEWGQSASDEWQRRAARESMLGRWGTPEDVAKTIRFLVSPAADFMTGQVIAVNGGWAR
ncbi:MAG TPA: SDR family oxidoreductase [Pirellulales bacterium]|jgi:3-oxoacyl-[acyl-carrier protein] reductase